MARESTTEKCAPKKIVMFFVASNPYSNQMSIQSCCHHIRSTKKKRSNDAKGNVSHGKLKMDKAVRWRELPCVGHSRSLYREQVVNGAILMSKEKKGDEEAKKKQRKE
jgi:hypothetical protein